MCNYVLFWISYLLSALRWIWILKRYFCDSRSRVWKTRSESRETNNPAVRGKYVGTCQKLAGGEGGGNRGRVTTFWDCRKGRGHEKWAVKRGRVMQMYARDHIEVHPQKKKEVLYLVKKKEQRNIMDINCEVLLQEFNKHLLFIYNNAIVLLQLWKMLLLMLLEFWLSFSSLSSASPSMLLWASWSSSFMSSSFYFI